MPDQSILPNLGDAHSILVEPRTRKTRVGAPCAPDVVFRRYAALAPLGPADIALLCALSDNQTCADAGQELDAEGTATRAPRLLLSGWACRFRMLSDGRRMIMAFLLPGDAISPRRPAPALWSTAALTPCRLIDARPIWNAASSENPAHAQLTRAQRLLDALDDCYLLDHVVRLGRQTALERMCHLLLELHWRLHAVGLVRAREFALPLTQEALGDAVGLSIVHVNRTLQDLRKRGYIATRQGRVALLQLERMAELSEFRAPFSARPGLGAMLSSHGPSAN